MGMFIVKVPPNMAYIVERTNRYHRKLGAGWHVLLPVLDKIKDKHSLKEKHFPIPYQQSYTRDNISVRTNGSLFIKVTNPVVASYAVDLVYRSVIILAQNSMCREIGLFTFDRIVNERAALNLQIAKSIDAAARSWGLQCTRFQLKDVQLVQEARYYHAQYQ